MLTEREILQRVAEGTLTIDEAELLLDAQKLDVDEAPPLRTVRRRGGLTPDLLVELATAGVSREWMREVRESGIGDVLDGQTLVELAHRGCSREWLRAAADLDISGETLVELANCGVSNEWLATLAEFSLSERTERIIVELAHAGVSREWLKEALSGEEAIEVVL